MPATKELRSSCFESEKRTSGKSTKYNTNNQINSYANYSLVSFHNLFVIQWILGTMKIGGPIACILICLFMILIAHQSFAYYEYEPNAKNSKIEIDLNVNINISGSKTKGKISGNLSLKK